MCILVNSDLIIQVHHNEGIPVGITYTHFAEGGKEYVAVGELWGKSHWEGLIQTIECLYVIPGCNLQIRRKVCNISNFI